jgi:hypothetical protein
MHLNEYVEGVDAEYGGGRGGGEHGHMVSSPSLAYVIRIARASPFQRV